MASGVGAIEIDFGSYPGSNEASATVTGQGEITALASAEAQIREQARLAFEALERKRARRRKEEELVLAFIARAA